MESVGGGCGVGRHRWWPNPSIISPAAAARETAGFLDADRVEPNRVTACRRGRGRAALTPWRKSRCQPRRIVEGEHPVRVWRTHRGMTARSLAVAAGIPSSYLSAIERGVKPGSVKALKSLATALDVPLDDLV